MIAETDRDLDPEEARATVARYEALLSMISDRLARQALRREIADLRDRIRDTESENISSPEALHKILQLDESVSPF